MLRFDSRLDGKVECGLRQGIILRVAFDTVGCRTLGRHSCGRAAQPVRRTGSAARRTIGVSIGAPFKPLWQRHTLWRGLRFSAKND
ncbi:MAG TPA: hypothetical protein VEX86_11720 [Longimicrobium sp.]|nr:hypothetical protein [Longimicrobium sp.]